MQIREKSQDFLEKFRTGSTDAQSLGHRRRVAAKGTKLGSYDKHPACTALTGMWICAYAQ